MTGTVENERGKSFQIITNPVNSNQYPAIRRMLDDAFDQYQNHINEKIYRDITDRLIALYNCCVKRIENMKVEFDQFQSPNQITSSVTIYRQDGEYQRRHINILSTYGPIELFVPEGSPSANHSTVDNFLRNISTTREFHGAIEEIITYFILEYTDYVPIYYTLAASGLYEDRLAFVNHNTKHLISISISPLPVINKICETGIADIHGFISTTRH